MSDTAKNIAEWRCEECGAVAAVFTPPRFESEREVWERPERIAIPYRPRVIGPARVRCLNDHESPVELPRPTDEQSADFEAAFGDWLADQAGVGADTEAR